MNKNLTEIAYNWQFLFLAANQDAIATAAQMGIDLQHAANVSFSLGGVRSSHFAVSRKLRSMRFFAATGCKDADYDAPMQAIAKEEERKEGGKS